MSVKDLTVKVDACSRSARRAIEAAGGTVVGAPLPESETQGDAQDETE